MEKAKKMELVALIAGAVEQFFSAEEATFPKIEPRTEMLTIMQAAQEIRGTFSPYRTLTCGAREDSLNSNRRRKKRQNSRAEGSFDKLLEWRRD